jgi:hypothetical protein
MSPKQVTLYWRTWGAVCAEFGWQNSDTEHRRAIHAEAGCKPSMKDFTNRDLDLYLAACRRLLGQRVTASTAGDLGERKRLIWRIRQDADRAGLDQAYLAKLSTDLYGLACWDELCLADLTNFRNAIHDRASSRVGADTRTAERRPRRRYILRPTPVAAPQPEPVHANADPF